MENPCVALSQLLNFRLEQAPGTASRGKQFGMAAAVEEWSKGSTNSGKPIGKQVVTF